MRILLDTPLLIRAVAIEARLGRVGFDSEPEKILLTAEASGWTELPVRAADTLLVRRLPSHHSDPFDRLLVAQAIAAGAVLLTSDATLPPYSPPGPPRLTAPMDEM